MFIKIELLLRKSESCCFLPGSAADVVVRLSSRIISGENTTCTPNVPGIRFRPGSSSGSGEGSTLSAEHAANSPKTPLQSHCCSHCCSTKERERPYFGKSRCRALCSSTSKSVHHHFGLIQRLSWEPNEG